MGRLLGLVLILAAAPARALSPELEKAFARTKWTPERVERFAREMPKAELHLHLDGALSPETVLRLAKEQKYAPLMDKTTAQVAALTVVADTRPTLKEALEPFHVVYPLLRRADALETVAYETLRAEKASNVLYAEVRFAPGLNAADGFTQEQALDAVLKGLARGKKDFGVDSRVILCLLRPDSLLSMEKNEKELALALKRKGAGVAGIDLAGDEAASPLERYAPMLAKAKKAGLGLTVHAGETPGSKDLAAALALGADRLGHAVQLAKDRKLEAKVAERGILVESNPTSNLRTSAVKTLDEHPAKTWRSRGVKLGVSTDDPGVFGTTMAGEYALLVREFGYTPRALVGVLHDSIDAAFLPAAEKAKLRAAADAALLKALD